MPKYLIQIAQFSQSMTQKQNKINELLDLENKVILITGSLGQVGSELVNTFLDLGSFVIGTDIDKSADIKIDNENYDCFKLDVNNPEEVRKVLSDIFSKYKKIDVLINNAGVNTFKHSRDRTEEDLDFVIGVNLKGTFFCIQSYAALLEENNLKGSIINTASHYGIISPDFRIYTDCNRRNSEIYGATKAGIIQMTKYFAVELADKGVRVNCVSPGGIFNPAQPQGDDFINNYSNRTPLGRMAKVQEIMGAYIYLASETSTYTTGQNIIVDGGMSAW